MCSAFGNLHSGVEGCGLFLVWAVSIKYENRIPFSFTCSSIIRRNSNSDSICTEKRLELEVKFLIFWSLATTLLLAPSIVYATTTNEYNRGYSTGVNEWNHFNSVGHNFECPLAKTAPHSDFCKGYDAALMFENSDH
jgi:hypothetical protein